MNIQYSLRRGLANVLFQRMYVSAVEVFQASH